MTTTTIEWTDTTWNPVTGCTKVSAGCKNCYADRLAPRVFAGQTVPTSIETTADGKGVQQHGLLRPRRFTDVMTHADRLDAPLRWRKPRRVFVNSMSDLFHEAVPDEFIDRVFAVMALAPRHTFQVLTKRPERMRAYLRDKRTEERVSRASVFFVPNAMLTQKGIEPDLQQEAMAGWATWPLPNVWLGVSVENQDAADERIPLLLQTPAAVRFLSCEPLLGPIDLSYIETGDHRSPLGSWCDPLCGAFTDSPLVTWVIAGGESGPGARPCDVAWIRSLVEQCKAAGVACFVKQLGAWVSGELDNYGYVNRYRFADGREWTPPIIGPLVNKRPPDVVAFRLCDAKGGDPGEWPADLNVREFPA